MGQQQQLRADAVIDSLETLRRRIDERFQDSSISKVCADLTVVARLTARRARATGRPNAARAFIVTLAIALLGALSFFALLAPLLGWSVWPLIYFDQSFTFYDFVEAVTGVLIVVGGAMFYVWASGTRGKRRFVFRHLHELRSFAHVIDMHQLTKDPITLSSAATRTASSPDRSMTPFELARYLDYCAEMLSLTGKLAALYGEQTTDPEILGAVNEIENLTSGIIRKIWQKIMMLDNDVAMQ